ncbi:MAG TPA: glycosyl hydrolase, partial [Bacillota bacterium]|nr:glycosyl hydrolase [Bacillota bacterium]
MKRTLGLLWMLVCSAGLGAPSKPELAADFLHPPDSARPWVYWYFMDGNLSRAGMSADLEAMKRAGIGGAIFLEVNIGIPRGPVEFMSPAWQELFRHGVVAADRLGLQLALGTGPGWCGTGGPWVKPEHSMQHLVASATNVSGPMRFEGVLPRPQPRTPFFGRQTLTPELAKGWQEFYRDVVVLAFPTPQGEGRIEDLDEKALYYRAPYSSQRGVKPFLPPPSATPGLPANQCIAASQIVDLTAQLRPDGRLVWEVPAGNWTILRFGRTSTGQTTRPAPAPGLGFECDKFDPAALDAHLKAFVEKLIQPLEAHRHPGRGLTMLHFDSWEMSSQNWSEQFRKEFRQRRGYDPLPFLPVMTGWVVENREISERFLWDLRQTAQELVVDNHVRPLKQLGRRYGLGLSLEPYDMNPCADLELGRLADVPQCEFWSQGYGYSTEYSCIEAVSLAHTLGRPVVAAEAFTAEPGEDWQLYPGAMKAQADWALCCGINRFIFHRYQHQPWLDRWPGMTMGPYGVHWERTQTWWDMVPAFHTYLARCQQLLQRGLPVADILYLAPEGAPFVFRAPNSATEGALPDRRGYNFDACAPSVLRERGAVKRGRIVFPDGMSYRLLVLPECEAMTPELLRKVKQLVQAGATVMGAPPRSSPSLVKYPKCDEQVQELAGELWGRGEPQAERLAGKGRVLFDSETGKSHVPPLGALSSAKWIWYPEGKPAESAPLGKRSFQKTFVMEAPRRIAAAKVVITADNAFELRLNGRPVASGNNFHQTFVAEVTSLVQPGTNVLVVTAENGGAGPNPAGVIGALEMRFGDGSIRVVATDNSWSAALSGDGPWQAALELGAWDMSPWKLTPESLGFPDLYPSYEATAQVLAQMGVAPDFQSDASVRYIHRREGEADLYFVANRENRPVSTRCRFRVAGRQPEWWDPVTGESRVLSQYAEKGGVTVVPLEFAPQESAFIVFRKPGRPSLSPGRNFPEWRTVMTLSAPWEVAFDPKWGGPQQVVFDALEDWSQRPEPGIKYYSGKAVYRTTFDVADTNLLGVEPIPAGAGHRAAASARQPYQDGSKRVSLSLGEVKNLGSVRLNGQALGIVWCAPWKVAVPAGLLQARNNKLEITVANLWPNRLIGDQTLPAEKRFCWTTRNPYQ